MGISTLAVDIPSELKLLVGDLADKSNLSLNELVARVLAREVERPDLSVIPRRRPGRPRKKSLTPN